MAAADPAAAYHSAPVETEPKDFSPVITGRPRQPCFDHHRLSNRYTLSLNPPPAGFFLPETISRMDPSITPDAGDTKWYWAIIGFLTAAVTGLMTKMWSRHEQENDEKDDDLKNHIIETARRHAEYDQRLIRLETREVATIGDIRKIVDEVETRIGMRVENQHDAISSKVETCAGAMNDRLDKLILAMASERKP